MTKTPSNIVLIGMPGAGKSTVGVILAKMTSRGFVDTDVLIQTSQGRTLQEIVDKHGYRVLRKIEEDVLLGLSVQNQVIATGGSAVYSHQAMAHLKSDGIVIFLDVGLDVLLSRVHDFSTRGLAKRPDQSFAELYDERLALYTRHADITVKCDRLTQEKVCERIIEKVRERV
jgi:shikimate kinase